MEKRTSAGLWEREGLLIVGRKKRFRPGQNTRAMPENFQESRNKNSKKKTSSTDRFPVGLGEKEEEPGREKKNYLSQRACVTKGSEMCSWGGEQRPSSHYDQRREKNDEVGGRHGGTSFSSRRMR